MFKSVQELTPTHRNYDHVASLWEHEKWLPAAAVKLAKSHYSAYMVRRMDGLRVISLNTDLCQSFMVDWQMSY
jgi:sphingomyelin phosphodiesterase